jgi:hypothetical protein
MFTGRESNREDIEDQNRRHGRRPYTDAEEERWGGRKWRRGEKPRPLFLAVKVCINGWVMMEMNLNFKFMAAGKGLV